MVLTLFQTLCNQEYTLATFLLEEGDGRHACEWECYAPYDLHLIIFPRGSVKMSLSPQDYWRAIVLYGNNVATYKIALALCLMDFARQEKTHVSMNELAQAFFHAYRQRPGPSKPIQPARPSWSVWRRPSNAEHSTKPTLFSVLQCHLQDHAEEEYGISGSTRTCRTCSQTPTWRQR